MDHIRSIALTIALALSLLGTAACESRRDECARRGGQVVTDVETKTKNGKTRTYTEYECVKDGEELFEWR
ncbi:hypothetical protein [Actinoplanes sp. NBRC 101535]|uniref:hypothetical protein n=1 Tax=Actinoplanes sp. NBRC 101535 TaxID=3032196 RepID=UPI0024A27E12|nr:hypothetical protein [Actinoplanes sp. NBRC 101535]GLY08332.1 hypothetical protein Acsp01_87110 [Actinoplanes sp. NBRC 101535]